MSKKKTKTKKPISVAKEKKEMKVWKIKLNRLSCKDNYYSNSKIEICGLAEDAFIAGEKAIKFCTHEETQNISIISISLVGKYVF